MKESNLAAKIAVFCCALTALCGVASAQIVTSLGNVPPTPGPGDITNFFTPDTSFGANEKPGGMNYYDDNGGGLISPGQTFVSKTNGVLTSVAYQMGNNAGTYSGGGSGTGPGLMTLRVFKLAGPGSTTATLLATYRSDPNFIFAQQDWLQWTGIAVPLTNGATYAYTIASGTNTTPGVAYTGSQMYCRVFCLTNGGYTNGSICLINAAGGANAVTYNATADAYCQNFDLGFSDLSVLQKPQAPIPAVSPGTTVYGGTTLTFVEEASGANLHYQWQKETDGGNTSLTNIPGANSSNLVDVATYASGNPVYYDVIVTNANGAATSAVVNITINPPSAPVLDNDLSVQYPTLSALAYVGASLNFSATFEGTLPIHYQWMTNSGSGFHPLPGATNATLTVTNLQTSSLGSVELIVSNSVGTNFTSTVAVTVSPDPPAVTTNQAYAYAVIQNNPLVYWRLGETGDYTAGNLPAYDSSGHGFDAIYGLNAIDNIAGPQSPAFPGFEATNTGVQLPGPNISGGHGYLVSPDLNINTNTVTFTAWINPTANVVTTVGLVFWRTSGGDAAGLDFGGGASGSGMHELGYTWNTNSSLTWNHDFNLYPPLNEWSFVALTVTPTNATIYLYYVDTNAATTNLFQAVNTLPHTAEAFSGGIIRIGDDTFDDYRVFPGYLDEVAIFTHALSQIQIENLFFTAIGAQQLVLLNSSVKGKQLTLTWPQGTLQESTNLVGPWITDTNQSPYTVTPSGSQKYYRVKVK
jgi:hypothetical protein